MKTNLSLLSLVFLAGCGSGSSSVCPDDGDPVGPVCLERVQTGEDFVTVSVPQAYVPGSDRTAKYMAPARDDPGLLPPLFQNLNRHLYHIEFLRTVFPERFSDLDQQGYLDLILERETRSYFSGNLTRIDDSEGGYLYGFNIYTAVGSDELLEVDEVRAVYAILAEAFLPETLVYTFDPADAMAREKALGWQDPGFPIYFY